MTHLFFSLMIKIRCIFSLFYLVFTLFFRYILPDFFIFSLFFASERYSDLGVVGCPHPTGIDAIFRQVSPSDGTISLVIIDNWRGVREAEGARLESVCRFCLPWVRIPPSPQHKIPSDNHLKGLFLS